MSGTWKRVVPEEEEIDWLASFWDNQESVKCSCCGDCDNERDAAGAEIERLEKDNERLRNVLRRIADAPWKSATVTGDIARKALER